MASKKSCVCSGKRQDILEDIETPKTSKSQSPMNSAGTTRTIISRPATQASMASPAGPEATSKACSACEKFITDLTFRFREAWMREDLPLQFQLVTAVPDLLARDEGGLEELARRFRCNVGFIKLAQVQRREIGPLTYPEAAIARKEERQNRQAPKVAFADSIREEEPTVAAEVAKVENVPSVDEVFRKVLLFYWDHSRWIPNNSILNTAISADEIANYRVVQFETSEAAKAQFLIEHPAEGLQIPLQVFSGLKPANFIWPLNTPFGCTTTGCKIHENFKLLLKAGNIQDSVDQVLEKMLCKQLDADCALFNCVNPNCPKPFTDVYEAPSGDVILKQWQKHNGKHRLEEEIINGLGEYAGIFESAFRAFAPHDFIAGTHVKYIEEQDAQEGVVVVYCGTGKDFNLGQTRVTFYSFQVVFGNGRVAFYVVGTDAQLEAQDQRSWAFHAFRSKVIEDIGSQGSLLSKYVYVSDVKKQHRNWINAANLACHEKDFGVPAQWVFMPKGHIRSECEAVDSLVMQSLKKHCQPEEGGKPENEAHDNEKSFSQIMLAWNAVEPEGRVKHIFVAGEEIERIKIQLESRILWFKSQGKVSGLMESHFWNVEEKRILETLKKFVVFKEHVGAATELLAIPLE